MKKYTKYNKIVKKYRKLLSAQVKKANPFDYDALFIFVTSLRYMLEYYETDDNVHGLDVAGHVRKDKLYYALYNFDEWQKRDDRLIKGLELIHQKYLTDSDEKTKEIKELADKIDKEATVYWNEFWNTIRDEFLYWWD